MKVSDLTMTPLVDMFLRAADELNFDNIDLNGPNNLGRARMVVELVSTKTNRLYSQRKNIKNWLHLLE